MTALPSPEDAIRALREGTGRDVNIAILDSGVELSHPDLAGLTLRDDVVMRVDGGRLLPSEGRGEDLFGHGTAIAAIIRRIAPETQLGSFRVLDGALRSRTTIISEAVREAMRRKYMILNCSFGSVGAQNVMPYKEWIDEAYLRRVHVVAACNNADMYQPEWPGHFPTVLTTNMARTTGELLFFRSDNLVEFAAAGIDVDVPWIGGTRKRVTGSSYATPVVVALLARLLSVFPHLSPLEAKSLFQRVAQPWDARYAGNNVPAMPSALSVRWA